MIRNPNLREMKKMLTRNIFSALCIIAIGSLPVQAQFSRADKRTTNPYTSQYQRIEAGSYHTLELRNGQLWAWGDNFHGQLGNGTQNPSYVPIQVGTDDNWQFVSAAAQHNLALKSDGTIWSWGDNSYGQLGDGTYNVHFTPQQIGSANDWVSISAGTTHSMAIKADGTLWAWGNNSNGQLGDGTTNWSNVPIQIGSANTWIKIAAGGYHSLAVKTNGTVWSWGENSYGQLGNGTFNNNPTPAAITGLNDCRFVTAGEYNSFVIKADGSLWDFGDNSYSQLGDGTTTNRNVPVGITYPYTSGWISVTAGTYHTMAIRSDGKLYAWGSNAYGQFMNGNITSTTTPLEIAGYYNQVAVTAGYGHTLVLLADGHVWGSGYNFQGQLGNGGNNDHWWRIDLRSPTTAWVTMASGYGHTLALRDNGTLWGWGYNLAGQLGDGTLTNHTAPTQIGTANNWVSVATGYSHTLALRADGSLWATGYNFNGALGDGSSIDQPSFIQIGNYYGWTSVAVGEESSFALRDNGTLWSWGYGGFGSLGHGNANNVNVPTQVGSATNWTSVKIGSYHALALQGDGTIWSSGSDSNGQLGNGAAGSTTTFAQIGNNVIGIAAGRYHSLGIAAGGDLYAWGANTNYQLGNNSNVDEQLPIQIDPTHKWLTASAAYSHSMALSATGFVAAWGLNSSGQIGDGSNVTYGVPVILPSMNNVVQLNSGGFHSSVLKSDRNTICATGDNSLGQLGDNTNNNSNIYSCNVAVCIAPALPVIAANDTTLCPGESAVLTITSGALNDALQWNWYSGSCGGTAEGTGTSLTVSPAATTTYYVRGEGACTTPGNCTAFTVNVIPVNINSTISVNLSTFTSNQSGATYQWVNCNTTQIIPGATSQSFIPTSNGDYGVIVTMSTCADTSACIFIGDVGTPEYTNPTFSIAPNPGSGTVQIQSNVAIVRMKMYDVLGNVVFTTTGANSNTASVDVSSMAKGVYFMEVTTVDGISTRRFVKE